MLRNLDVDHCASHPCLNGGTCTTNGRSFSCQCKSEWTGPTCLQSTEP